MPASSQSLFADQWQLLPSSWMGGAAPKRSSCIPCSTRSLKNTPSPANQSQTQIQFHPFERARASPPAWDTAHMVPQPRKTRRRDGRPGRPRQVRLDRERQGFGRSCMRKTKAKPSMPREHVHEDHLNEFDELYISWCSVEEVFFNKQYQTKNRNIFSLVNQSIPWTQAPGGPWFLVDHPK